MSVVINTNSAATIASNNLSASNAMLQRSLNRLSSGSKIVNASDDAGGVAVASRLSAAAKRSGAANANIGNAVSFLQNQDSVLKTMGKMLERMSELKTLYTDTTKSSTDLANYTLEFDKLGDQLDAMAQTKYNGNSLLGSTSNLVVKTDDAGSTYSLSTPTSNMAVSGYGDYAIDSPGAGTTAAAGGFYTKTGIAIPGATTAGTASGSLILNGAVITVASGDTVDMIAVKINANSATKTSASVVDGKLKLTATQQGTGTSDTSNANKLSVLGSTPETLTHLGLTTTAVAPVEDNVTAAIQAVAKQRSANGSDQSVLGYYAELASATKTNYESAISKIMDVDVAEESTQLARWNTLVQAGTAMVAQANGTTQNVLTLLRG